MKINGRKIGYNEPPYIVAEISCNHNGSLVNAKWLIEVAKEAGADAVKFQTYEPGDLTTPDDKFHWDLYERALTPREWHVELFEYCIEMGITGFSSPFSVDAVEFLELAVNPPAYKIASPEALRTHIVDAVAATGKPTIVSTGALSTWAQIERLHDKFKEVAFLHCIAQYPARVQDANLFVLEKMDDLGYMAGLSDHTPGHDVAVAATALGCVMIEKHIKLNDDCIDAEWSLDPSEFKAMVNAVHDIYQGMGEGRLKATCGPRAVP